MKNLIKTYKYLLGLNESLLSEVKGYEDKEEVENVVNAGIRVLVSIIEDLETLEEKKGVGTKIHVYTKKQVYEEMVIILKNGQKIPIQQEVANILGENLAKGCNDKHVFKNDKGNVWLVVDLEDVSNITLNN